MNRLIRNRRLADMTVGVVAGLCTALLWPAAYSLVAIAVVAFVLYAVTVLRSVGDGPEETGPKNDDKAEDADFTIR